MSYSQAQLAKKEEARKARFAALEAALPPEKLDELEAQNQGRIAHVVGAGGYWQAVFRAPKRSEYKLFRSQANNPVQKPDAQETLARKCVVFASPKDLDALLEDFPGIAEAIGDKLAELAGMATDESGKS
jgi:hypothetical protein